jgi:cell division protein FtsL
MKLENNNIGEEYTAGVMEEPDSTVSSISIPRIREPRDMVYSGIINMPLGEDATDNGSSSSRSKTRQKRKISPFTIVLILFGVAVTIVLYIGNILVVSRLLNQINQLQIKHRQIVNQQEQLKAQVIKLSNLERIQHLAHDQLGLQNIKQLPVWIEIDPDQINEVEEVIQQMERKQ